MFENMFSAAFFIGGGTHFKRSAGNRSIQRKIRVFQFGSHLFPGSLVYPAARKKKGEKQEPGEKPSSTASAVVPFLLYPPTPRPPPALEESENSQQGWLFSPRGSQGYKNKSCHFLSPCSAVCACTPSDESVVLFMTLEGIKIQINSAFYHWNWPSHFTGLQRVFCYIYVC